MDRSRTTRIILFAAIFIVGSVHFFAHETNDRSGRRGARIDGDGIYYFLYLRSLVIDHDVDFTNDYRDYRNPWRYGETETGKPGNPASIGSALMWLPFYSVAHALAQVASKMGCVLREAGMSRVEVLGALYGTFIYGFLTILLMLRVCRRHLPDTPALLGTLGVAFGGGLFFYTNYQPSYSHAHAAFAVALFIERWDATRDHRRFSQWLLLGGLGGLMALIRPQLCVVALLPLFDLIRHSVFLIRRRQLGWNGALGLAASALAGAVVAVVVFSPQMLAWKSIYGTYLTYPQGESFMRWEASLWSQVLFHPRAGLLPWMPLAAPALAGLVLLARRDRGLGLPLIAFFAVAVYVNGACWDWWGGYSYGARRMVATLPLLGLGLATLLDIALRWMRRRPGAVAAGAAAVVIGTFCLLNLKMMHNRRWHNVSWDNHRPFYQVYSAAATDLAKDVHEATGNPLSWPANLAFAARYGGEPGDYDAVSGRALVDDRHPIVHAGFTSKLKEDMQLPHDGWRPFLGSGFGDVRQADGRPAVPVRGSEATILLPMIKLQDLDLQLTSRAVVEGTRLSLRINGSHLGNRRLRARWQTLTFPVACCMLRRGINTLALVHEQPRALTAVERTIGSTGARAPVDIALLSAGYPADNVEIWVDGVQRAPGGRGLNAVAIDPDTGAVLQTGAFDFRYWKDAAQIFKRWIGAVPRGVIVALAVRGDASRQFNVPAVVALEKIGASVNLRGRNEFAYGAVGLKGASKGTALEKLAKHSTTLVLGRKPRAWRVTAYHSRLVLQVTGDTSSD